MPDWQEDICDANGIKIHYTRTGGNKPPLILLHGLMTNGLCWTSLAHTLESKYDVIMPDARGHGKSSIPESGYSYEDHADDVAGLINALRLSQPILLGHSMGGMTAAVAASRKPNLLNGLILADPTFISIKVQREVYESDVALKHRQILNMSFEEVMADARRRHPTRSQETLELYARARLQTSINALDILTPPNPDYKQLIRKIDIPSLLIIAGDGIVSFAAAQKLQSLNPKLKLEQIREAGHNLQIDQPERFAEIVKSFLRFVDEVSN